MKVYILIFAAALTNAAFCVNFKEWQRENMAAMDAVAQSPPDVAFPVLSPRLNIGYGQQLAPEQTAVLHRAQELLMASPDHARFYQRRMDHILEALAAEPNLDRKALIYYHTEPAADVEGIPDLGYSYLEASSELRRLRFLPGSESVEVLASYLKHPEGRDGKTAGGQNSSESAEGVSVDATTSLMAIGIENPPLVQWTGEESAWVLVDAWKEWWDQIEAGKRTYRLKGSPIEYGPHGPVDSANLKHRDPARLAASDVGGTTPSPETKAAPKTGMIAALVAALALLAIALRQVLRRRKQA